jgi:nitrogen regulatory protein PII
MPPAAESGECQILMKKSEAGRIRDGEVIVYDVEGAIRFRNDERGEAAL